MKILKVFNNNSIAAISDDLGDIILTGSGIGFQKKAAPLLYCIKKQSSIPLIGKMADNQKNLHGNGLRLIHADIRAADYYRTALQMKYKCAMKNEFNQGIIII